jgi:LAO/AO transport system kinase
VNRADRYLGRLISALEGGSEEAERVLAGRWRPGRRASVVGISGPPGVGKSVLTGCLAEAAHGEGRRVAVLAVDPSSPRSGGAILADRIRMQARLADLGVFVGSVASRGALGGLSRVVPAAVRALESAGYEVVLVETVGVGQNEADIAHLADTVVLVQAPGAGDEVQGLKAGILEMADVFVVNKDDRPGADEAAGVLAEVARGAAREGWRPPVVRTVAIDGSGLADLWKAIGRHAEWLEATGEVERRRRSRVEAEVLGAARAELAARLGRVDVAGLVMRGEATPSAVVQALFGVG